MRIFSIFFLFFLVVSVLPTTAPVTADNLQCRGDATFVIDGDSALTNPTEKLILTVVGSNCSFEIYRLTQVPEIELKTMNQGYKDLSLIIRDVVFTMGIGGAGGSDSAIVFGGAGFHEPVFSRIEITNVRGNIVGGWAPARSVFALIDFSRYPIQLVASPAVSDPRMMVRNCTMVNTVGFNVALSTQMIQVSVLFAVGGFSGGAPLTVQDSGILSPEQFAYTTPTSGGAAVFRVTVVTLGKVTQLASLPESRINILDNFVTFSGTQTGSGSGNNAGIFLISVLMFGAEVTADLGANPLVVIVGSNVISTNSAMIAGSLVVTTVYATESLAAASGITLVDNTVSATKSWQCILAADDQSSVSIFVTDSNLGEDIGSFDATRNIIDVSASWTRCRLYAAIVGQVGEITATRGDDAGVFLEDNKIHFRKNAVSPSDHAEIDIGILVAARISASKFFSDTVIARRNEINMTALQSTPSMPATRVGIITAYYNPFSSKSSLAAAEPTLDISDNTVYIAGIGERRTDGEPEVFVHIFQWDYSPTEQGKEPLASWRISKNTIEIGTLQCNGWEEARSKSNWRVATVRQAQASAATQPRMLNLSITDNLVRVDNYEENGVASSVVTIRLLIASAGEMSALPGLEAANISGNVLRLFDPPTTAVQMVKSAPNTDFNIFTLHVSAAWYGSEQFNFTLDGNLIVLGSTVTAQRFTACVLTFIDNLEFRSFALRDNVMRVGHIAPGGTADTMRGVSITVPGNYLTIFIFTTNREFKSTSDEITPEINIERNKLAARVSAGTVPGVLRAQTPAGQSGASQISVILVNFEQGSRISPCTFTMKDNELNVDDLLSTGMVMVAVLAVRAAASPASTSDSRRFSFAVEGNRVQVGRAVSIVTSGTIKKAAYLLLVVFKNMNNDAKFKSLSVLSNAMMAAELTGMEGGSPTGAFDRDWVVVCGATNNEFDFSDSSDSSINIDKNTVSVRNMTIIDGGNFAVTATAFISIGFAPESTLPRTFSVSQNNINFMHLQGTRKSSNLDITLLQLDETAQEWLVADGCSFSAVGNMVFFTDIFWNSFFNFNGFKFRMSKSRGVFAKFEVVSNRFVFDKMHPNFAATSSTTSMQPMMWMVSLYFSHNDGSPISIDISANVWRLRDVLSDKRLRVAMLELRTPNPRLTADSNAMSLFASNVDDPSETASGTNGVEAYLVEAEANFATAARVVHFSLVIINSDMMFRGSPSKGPLPAGGNNVHAGPKIAVFAPSDKITVSPDGGFGSIVLRSNTLKVSDLALRLSSGKLMWLHIFLLGETINATEVIVTDSTLEIGNLTELGTGAIRTSIFESVVGQPCQLERLVINGSSAGGNSKIGVVGVRTGTTWVGSFTLVAARINMLYVRERVEVSGCFVSVVDIYPKLDVSLVKWSGIALDRRGFSAVLVARGNGVFVQFGESGGSSGNTRIPDLKSHLFDISGSPAQSGLSQAEADAARLTELRLDISISTTRVVIGSAPAGTTVGTILPNWPARAALLTLAFLDKLVKMTSVAGQTPLAPAQTVIAVVDGLDLTWNWTGHAFVPAGQPAASSRVGPDVRAIYTSTSPTDTFPDHNITFVVRDSRLSISCTYSASLMAALAFPLEIGRQQFSVAAVSVASEYAKLPVNKVDVSNTAVAGSIAFSRILDTSIIDRIIAASVIRSLAVVAVDFVSAIRPIDDGIYVRNVSVAVSAVPLAFMPTAAYLCAVGVPWGGRLSLQDSTVNLTGVAVDTAKTLDKHHLPIASSTFLRGAPTTSTQLALGDEQKPPQITVERVVVGVAGAAPCTPERCSLFSINANGIYPGGSIKLASSTVSAADYNPEAVELDLRDPFLGVSLLQLASAKLIVQDRNNVPTFDVEANRLIVPPPPSSMFEPPEVHRQLINVTLLGGGGDWRMALNGAEVIFRCDNNWDKELELQTRADFYTATGGRGAVIRLKCYQTKTKTSSFTPVPTRSKSFSRTRHATSGTRGESPTRTPLPTMTVTALPTKSVEATPSRSLSQRTVSLVQSQSLSKSLVATRSRDESASNNTATRSFTPTALVPTSFGLLDPQLVAALVTTSASVASGAALFAGAPTVAMTVTRGLLSLELIGCPRFHPQAGKRWVAVEPSFTLAPGFALGDTELGGFYRAAVLSFVAVGVLGFLVSLFPLPDPTPQLPSAPPPLEDEEQQQTQQQQQQQANKVKPPKTSLLPSGARTNHFLFLLLFPFVGAWASTAGTLFAASSVNPASKNSNSTFDGIITIAPLLAFLLVLGLAARRLYFGVSQTPLKGRLRCEYHLTQSFLVRKDAGAAVGSRVQIWAERFLRSGAGRWLVVGDLAWTRDAECAKEAAGASKPKKSKNKSSNSKKKDKSESNNNNADNLLVTHTRMMGKLKGPTQSTSAFGGEETANTIDASLRLQISSFFGIISVFAAVLVAFLAGVSKGLDNEKSVCGAAIAMAALVSVFMLLLAVWLRPFIVTARNVLIICIELCVALAAVIVWGIHGHSSRLDGHVDYEDIAPAQAAAQLIVIIGATGAGSIMMLVKVTSIVLRAVSNTVIVAAPKYFASRCYAVPMLAIASSVAVDGDQRSGGGGANRGPTLAEVAAASSPYREYGVYDDDDENDGDDNEEMLSRNRFLSPPSAAAAAATSAYDGDADSEQRELNEQLLSPSRVVGRQQRQQEQQQPASPTTTTASGAKRKKKIVVVPKKKKIIATDDI